MTSFVLDKITFSQEKGEPGERGVATDDLFVLVKTDPILRFYESLRPSLPKAIMEVGINEGGSLVYFDKLFCPTKLVGVDMRKMPIEALEKYREQRPHIVTYYGRYQDKMGTLMAARQNFPKGIDLVVDNASHLYEQTKATFLMLFPLVRPGGHYVIEDWAWAHKRVYQDANATRADKPALTNLLFELVLLASQTGAVQSLRIDRNIVCIQKGRGVLEPKCFDFANCLRGRALGVI